MSTLIRWNPRGELLALPRRRTRLWDEAFRGEGASLQGWGPATDIREDEQEFVITAELPGLKTEDIHVNMEKGHLTLRGERRFEHEDKRDHYHHIERSYGQFHRTFAVPSTIDPEGIRAEYREGILTVHLPKSEAAKPQEISVETA